jgi:hypothetical protein
MTFLSSRISYVAARKAQPLASFNTHFERPESFGSSKKHIEIREGCGQGKDTTLVAPSSFHIDSLKRLRSPILFPQIVDKFIHCKKELFTTLCTFLPTKNHPHDIEHQQVSIH